jgi:hypothetical protein
MKEKLLARSEDKILPAIHTPEYPILEFHDPRLIADQTDWPDRPPSSK